MRAVQGWVKSRAMLPAMARCWTLDLGIVGTLGNYLGGLTRRLLIPYLT